MKIILTNKKEKANIKQITELMRLIFFDYNIDVIDKKENKPNAVNKKVIRKQEKIIIEKPKKVITKNPEEIKRQREWLEDIYYSQNKERAELENLIDYYSSSKRISSY